MSKKSIGWLCLLIIIAAAIVVHTDRWNYDTMKGTQDIYYLWQDGQRLLRGENPYARILLGNMNENHKYPTYFPVFYLLSYFTQLIGLKDYSSWIAVWRYIFLIFNLAIGSLLFYAFGRRQLWLLASFAACFWLFNRWTIYVTKVAQIDFIPICLLVLSLLIFYQHKWASLLLFSLSLGVKQIAIFMVPLYLIWVWQSTSKDQLKTLLLAAAAIASIPLLTSLPFIIWNAESWIKSILFSASRVAENPFNAPSLFKETAGLRFLPTLVLMILIYVSACKRQIGLYTSALLTLFVFINFNAILFTQYFCWVMPFVPLSLADFLYPHARDQTTSSDAL
ncbi:MAG TPA: hypothetical protein V6C57_18190 [Coleofasciculaceae cyanobacterium]